MRKTEAKTVLFIAMLFLGYTHSGEAAPSEKFHSGSIGQCEGCHGLGNNGSGAGFAEQGGRSTLRGSDPSSTCLICHQGGGPTGSVQHLVSTAGGGQLLPAQLTPAGDFAWLKRSYQWRGEAGGWERSPGGGHGHNIVATDFGYTPSVRNSVAPGGSYASGALSCISCHDPHGNYRRNADGSITSGGERIVASGSYASSPPPAQAAAVGSYRLLAGRGYRTMAGESLPFTADPPTAVAPDSYNRSEAASETRVAYGKGMSEWCQNCHPQVHANTGTMHPAGAEARLSSEIQANYNYYLKSGDLNGSSARSYTSLVPYEMGTDDYEVLKGAANSDGSNLSGPSGGNPNVMCLSCHRAHASAWDHMARWNMGATFLVENGHYPGIDNRGSAENAQGRSEVEAQRGYYDRPASRFADFQRSLCNKCHAKD